MATQTVSTAPIPVTPLPRGLRVSARVAQGVLALWVLFVPIAIGVNLAQRDLLLRVHGDSASLRLSDLLASDHQVSVVNGVYFGLLAVSAIAWMVWWVLACRAASDRRPQRYGRGWAFGGWFVPFAALVVPKRVADDLWTAGREPRWPKDQPARSSWTILAWWTAWLVSGFVAVLTIHSDQASVTRMLTINAVYLARGVVILVAALLAIRFVGLVTTGFTDQVASPVPVDTAPTARTRRRSVLVLVAIAGLGMVVAVTVASRAAFDIEPHPDVTIAGPDGRRYTPSGEHFSIVVPAGWVQMAQRDLPPGIVFGATQLGDGQGMSGLTVAEGPAGAAIAPDELRAQLTSTFDVIGPITVTSVELRAGTAECFSFNAKIENVPEDVRLYVLRGVTYDHVIAVVAGSDVSGGGEGQIDRMVRSFRVDAGQGA